jgi:hypothetical protein
VPSTSDGMPMQTAHEQTWKCVGYCYRHAERERERERETALHKADF